MVVIIIYMLVLYTYVRTCLVSYTNSGGKLLKVRRATY